MSNPVFKYDPARPRLTRLLKLDLNGVDAPLSGKLISFTNSNNAWMTLDLPQFFKSFGEYSDDAMEQLGDGSGYDALSYTWGDPKDEYQLELSTIGYAFSDGKIAAVDNEPHRNGTLQIHGNLHALLQELRRKKYNRFIWIDAICIDQNSPEDKRNQVPMMRDIYEYAKCVYIWLGEATAVEKGALQIMPAITNKLLRIAPNVKLDPSSPSTFESVDLPSPNHEIWRAFGSIITRPWWSRLWTLQEVVVATDLTTKSDNYDYKTPTAYVLCGDKKISWAVFEAFAAAVARVNLEEWIISAHWGIAVDDQHGFDSIKEIRTCRESYRSYGWAVSLSALVLATRRRKASVPADMVIGQLALLDRPIARQLALDSSQPAARVFVTFGKHYIRQEAKECLLNHLATRDTLAGLPSWCPNFASPPETLSLGSRWLGHYRTPAAQSAQMYQAGFMETGKWALPRSKVFYARYMANALTGRDPLHNQYSAADPRRVQLEPGSDRILLSGLDLDEVSEIVDCNPAADTLKFLSFNSVQQTAAWDAACLALARRTLPPGAPGFDVYARTLAANRSTMFPAADTDVVFDRHSAVDFAAAYLGFRRFVQATLDAGESLAEEGNLAPDAARYARVLERVARRRRFFATRGGRIGLGPGGTRVGDQVAVVFFCPTVYLLRQGARARRMVGEAYVHGLMYGEALGMLEKGEVGEKQWVIE